MVNIIKGLEQCIWKNSSKDKNSTSFQDITPERKDAPLWQCKYNCLGYDDTKRCYVPVSRFPESKAYAEAVKRYYDGQKTD